MKINYDFENQEIILQKNVISNDNIKLIFTGDFAPINRIEAYCNDKERKYIFETVKNEIWDKDFSIINLEAPLTDFEKPLEKVGPNIRANPNCINLLKYFKFDAVCLANNHIKDYGEKGIEDTIEVCKSNDILTVGAGKNIKEAANPLIIEKNNIRFAIFNFAENEFSIATEDSAGANPLDPYNIFLQIKKIKINVDFVIIIIHGGIEHYSYPSPRLKKVFHFFADIGADLVIGHHTHCISGFELYNNVPLFYSLGNFLFDWPGETFSKWFEGFFIKVYISKNTINKIKIIPYEQCKDEISIKLLEKQERKSYFENFLKISDIIKDDELLKRKWQDLIAIRSNDYISSLYGLNKIQRFLFKRGKYHINKDKLLRMLNIIRCEAHNELSVSILEKEIKRG